MTEPEVDDEQLSDEAHGTNPAGRLYLVLNHIKLAGAHSTAQKPIAVRELVTAFLELDPADNPAYYVAYASLVQLPLEARAQIAALESPAIPKSTLARPLDTVETVLHQAATSRARAHDFNAKVDSGVLVGLETTSAILRHHNTTRPTNATTIDEIRTLATQVIDALADSDIPKNVRESLRLHANRIITTANLYKVRGADALVQEMDGLTGAMVTNAPQIPGFLDNPVAKRVIALGNAITAATVILGTPNAIAGGVDYIRELNNPKPSIIVDEAPPPVEHPIELPPRDQA